MKLSKMSVIWILLGGLFAGLLLVVTFGAKDSEENQLDRRLKAFTVSLPEEVRSDFTTGRYEEVKTSLAGRIGSYKAYLAKIPVEKQTAWLKAEYDGIDAGIVESCPADLREFYKGYYKVLDAECIQGFTEAEVVDFFRIYFVEKLAKIRGK